MTDEQKAAYVIGQAACLMAEIAGMQAENQQRAASGFSPAYVQRDFESAIDRYSCHHNAALTLFHG